MNGNIQCNKLQVFGSIVFGLTLGLIVVSAGEYESIAVVVPKGDRISVNVPQGFKHTILQPAPSLPPTLKINSVSNSVSLQITFLPDPEGRFAASESVDRAVTQANQHYVAGSVEKGLKLTQIVSTNGHGSYASFTDADLANVPHPRPGQFKNVSSGVFVVKNNLASFTLLTNDPASLEYRQALKIISEGISIR